MDDSDAFLFEVPSKLEDVGFLDTLPVEVGGAFEVFDVGHYPVIHYYEQLFLESALVVATHTVWKFMVTEARNAFANTIHVQVGGNYEPFNEPHTVAIDVNHCQSAEEFETLSKARRVINEVPTWKAYHLPPVLSADVRFPLPTARPPTQWGC
jgi:hypothetical protein